MAYHLNVMLDQKLAAALREHMRANRMNLSNAVRDLLRAALKSVPKSRDRGWHVGRSEGYAAGKREANNT